MSVEGSDSRSWSWKRWLALIVGIVALQVGLLVWLSDRRPPVSESVGSPVSLNLPVAGVRTQAFEEWLLQGDPTLFALPGDRGFAAESLRGQRRLDYAPMDWSEPVRWLAATGLGAVSFSSGAGGPASTGWMSQVGSAVKPPPPVSAVEVSVLPMSRSSTMRPAGGLARRGIRSAPEIPLMAHTNLLSETEVRVVVDPAGRVFSAVVLSGSGLRVADEKAVELARQVQFGLALGEAPPPLESGSLIFEWRTVDPKGAQGSP